STADAAAGHQFPVRTLANGTSDRAMRAIAIAKGNGPDHPDTAGSAWQTVGPLMVEVQDSAPPGRNWAASASTDKIGAAIAIASTRPPAGPHDPDPSSTR